MGSFTASKSYAQEDHEDDDFEIPEGMTGENLLAFLRENAAEINPPMRRDFQDARIPALGEYCDNFVKCPKEALTWKHRRFYIVREILNYSPDIICLQEIDHFKFFEKSLGSQGYKGIFYPKPESPCIYIKENNGPDGCVIFYRSARFHLRDAQTTILKAWKIESNQVAILLRLEDDATGNSVCVATTHLKARKGALLSTIRNEQGKDLLSFVKNHAEGYPIMVCGDFNAEANEPIYHTMQHNPILSLSSAYKVNGLEPAYTSWKVREDGEQRCTIDYIFYSEDRLNVRRRLNFPADCEIGPSRLPSSKYPSDHLSLICDFEVCEKSRGK